MTLSNRHHASACCSSMILSENRVPPGASPGQAFSGSCSGTDGTMQRRSRARAWVCGIGVVAALAVLSACSTYDSLFGSRPSTTASAPPAASPPPSFTARFTTFVRGGPSTAMAQGDPPGQADLDCPGVQIRQGASTYDQSAQDNGSAALSLRFQA